MTRTPARKKSKEKLPAGITKRGTSYRISIMRQGNRATGTAETLEEAKGVRDRLLLELSGEAIKEWTLGEAFDGYVTGHLEVSGATASTINGFYCAKRPICGFFPDNTSLSQVTEADLVALAQHLLGDKGLSRDTARIYMGSLRRAMEYATRLRAMVTPIPTFPHIKRTDNRKVRYLSREEEGTIVGALTGPHAPLDSALISFLADTGLRVGSEALPLAWSEVDFAENKVFVWKGKSKEPRQVPMTGRVREALLDLKRKNPSSAGPFEGLAYYNFNGRWRQAVRASGVSAQGRKMTPHIPRHTFCTRLAMNGVELVVIKALAGHSNINTTMMYAHFIPQRLATAISSLNLE